MVALVLSKVVDRLCEELVIPLKLLDDETKKVYREQRFNAEELVQKAAVLDTILNHELIVIGGIVVSPQLLGYRQMRRPSNDLDTVTTENGIRILHREFGQNGRNDSFFRTVNYGDIFLDYGKVPCSFDVAVTHSWTIPFDFYQRIKTISIGEGQVNVIAPEYLITLKIRRCIRAERIYGKDILDIANVLLAPYFRSYLSAVDLQYTAALLREHAFLKSTDFEQYILPMRNNVNNLRFDEKKLFLDQLAELQSYVIPESRAMKRVYVQSLLMQK